MAQYIANRVATAGADAALVDERGSTTWTDLNTRVNQIIAALRGAGIESGDTIAVFSGNCREFLEIMAAAAHCGVIYVPVNWHFTTDELQYVVDDAGCKMLFAEGQFHEVTSAVKASNGQPLTRIGIRMTPAQTAADGFIDYEHFLAAQPSDEPEAQTLGGPMFYTSGTTGRPKGVRSSASKAVMPVEMLELMGGSMAQMLGIPNTGRTFVCGPMYHSAQWAFSFLVLMTGSQIVTRHRFDAAESLALIDAHQITNVHLVPTQFSRFLKLDAAVKQNFKGDSLQVVWHGAAPCPPMVKRQMIDWWGPVINEYYGSTEGSIVTTASAEEWLARPGTVGKQSAMVEITIVDENGAARPVGESGDIYVRNLMGSDFEYHNEPEKTEAVHLKPGVFTFGDVGYFDEDGYLYLSDRKIDMIISGGVNIYPAEIEGVLATHALVQDVAVFGIPNEEFGEEVKAAVELVPGATVDPALAETLAAFCREHLAGYKTPKSFDFVVDMPRHETGKLYKRKLRDPYWEGTGRLI